MKKYFAFIATSLLLLTACTREAESPQPPTSTTVSATQSSELTSSSTETTTPVETTTAEVAIEPTNTPATPIAEKYAVGCEPGLGEIRTTWSDGSVGGWSQYCQNIMDKNVAAEAAANKRTCDGWVCRYPSGAEVPDPNRPPIPKDTSQAVCDNTQCVYPNGYIAQVGDMTVPNYLKPGNSPWVQGQLDWSNCLKSGKTSEQCVAELNQ